MRTPALAHPSAAVFLGDCLDVLAEMPDDSVDAIVTDPPYGLEFMGKEWDSFKTGRSASYASGGQITETEFKNLGALPSYVSRPAKRCGNCGKQAWSGSPCKCPEPRWIMDNSPLHAFQAFNEAWCREAFRVLKPGGHLLAFGGTRTWHRLAVAVEDAGFEVRDSIAWLYGSGFPKSLDVSKAIDKRKDWTSLPILQQKIKAARTALGISQSEAARRVGLIGPDESLGGGGFMWFETGMRVPTREQYPRLKEALGLDDECDLAFEAAEREVLSSRTVTVEGGNGGWSDMVAGGRFKPGEHVIQETAPATPAAQQWQGWGTALKPAFEPIVVARKPLVGTVAANVLAHGTGALNIDATRVESGPPPAVTGRGWDGSPGYRGDRTATDVAHRAWENPSGRWPANVLLDGSQAEALDEQSGPMKDGVAVKRNLPDEGARQSLDVKAPTKRGEDVGYGGGGGASRFFPTFRYQAKAPTRERPTVVAEDGTKTAHPTVKPLALMRWLVRLVTPPGGTVLDTFAGSGATVEAAIQEGFYAFGIEREADYLPLIQVRLDRNAVEPEEGDAT